MGAVVTPYAPSVYVLTPTAELVVQGRVRVAVQRVGRYVYVVHRCEDEGDARLVLHDLKYAEVAGEGAVRVRRRGRKVTLATRCEDEGVAEALAEYYRSYVKLLEALKEFRERREALLGPQA